jgi:hypothetical protein
VPSVLVLNTINIALPRSDEVRGLAHTEILPLRESGQHPIG